MKLNSESIRFLRELLHLKQSELARELNVTQQYISEIERGLRPVTEDLSRKLCRELKVPDNFTIAIKMLHEMIKEKQNEDEDDEHDSSTKL